MRKAASFSRWSLLMGVACGLAMLTAANCAARAESIDIMISGPGFSFDLGAFQTGVPTPQNFGSVDTSAGSPLNSTLVADGSAYQISAIGGTSDVTVQSPTWHPLCLDGPGFRFDRRVP